MLIVYQFILFNSGTKLVEEGEPLIYHQNFNLEDIVTPINVQKFEAMLIQSEFPKDKTAFLVDGFTDGFDIGYNGLQDRQDQSNNLPFSIGNSTILWNKVMKEVKVGRYAGPFEKIPFKNYMQSPIGLVPKSGNKTRLIFHLSYQFKSGLGSLNSNTPKDRCSVKYRDLDAVDLVSRI